MGTVSITFLRRESVLLTSSTRFILRVRMGIPLMIKRAPSWMLRILFSYIPPTLSQHCPCIVLRIWQLTQGLPLSFSFLKLSCEPQGCSHDESSTLSVWFPRCISIPHQQQPTPKRPHSTASHNWEFFQLWSLESIAPLLQFSVSLDFLPACSPYFCSSTPLQFPVLCFIFLDATSPYCVPFLPFTRSTLWAVTLILPDISFITATLQNFNFDSVHTILLCFCAL